MAEKNTELVVRMKPLVDWLKRQDFDVSELEGVEFVVNGQNLFDYIDEKFKELQKQVEPLEDFFEKVVKPAHAKEKRKKFKERKEDVKIEEKLTRIAELSGEARKQALRKLILGDKNE